jgi:thioester reductase-like protein
LTGTTGSLGAHVLAQLVRLENVKAVYCLVRASSPSAAKDRVFSTLASKKLSVPDETKVICLPSDFSRDNLGLETDVIQKLKTSLTAVIHSAWAVNFNLGVSSFEKQHIRGAYNLINLCLSVQTIDPAKFYFCSSISVAAGAPLPATIQEAHLPALSYAQNMGYAHSKLVTETIIKAAAEETGMEARVLRVGQIIGDTSHGLWNSTEAIPLMIQSAVTIGALPALDETPSWLPVDEVARSVIELTNLNSASSSQTKADPSIVYHVNNPHLFHWTHDLLPALREAGLTFVTVPQREWVARLRASDQDPQKNPTIKLIDFFADKYGNDRPGRSGLVFVTEKTGERSEVIRDGYDVIGKGLIQKCVDSWKEKW